MIKKTFFVSKSTAATIVTEFGIRDLSKISNYPQSKSMVEQRQRQRRYFLGANWKCNGTTAFVKDIVTHLINDLEYD